MKIGTLVRQLKPYFLTQHAENTQWVTDAMILNASISKLTAGSLTVVGTIGAGGAWQTGASGARFVIDNLAIKAYNADDIQTVNISSDGSGWLGNSTDFYWLAGGVGGGTPYVKITNLIAGDLSVIGTITGAGEWRLGTGTIGVDFSGIRLNTSGLYGYNNDVVMTYLQASDGKIYAGGGVVILDNNGILIQDTASVADAKLLFGDIPGASTMTTYVAMYDDAPTSRPVISFLIEQTDVTSTRDGFTQLAMSGGGLSSNTISFAFGGSASGAVGIQYLLGRFSGQIETYGEIYPANQTNHGLTAYFSGPNAVALKSTGAFVTGSDLFVGNQFTHSIRGSTAGLGVDQAPVTGADFAIKSSLLVGATVLAGFHYDRASGDFYLGGDNTQAGNFYIKDSAGDIKVTLASDGDSTIGVGNLKLFGALYPGNQTTHYVTGGASGIGIDGSPENYYSKNLVIHSANNGGLTIAAATTSDVNYLMFADGTSGADAYRGYIAYYHSTNLLLLAANAIGGVYIDSVGNVGVASATSAWVKFGILNSGSFDGSGGNATAAQIDFRGTSAATTDIRGLTIQTGTTAESFTAAAVTGIYIPDAIKGTGSTITTLYGLYIGAQTVGATNWGIYALGANYFGAGYFNNTTRYISDDGTYTFISGGLKLGAALYPGNQTTHSITGGASGIGVDCTPGAGFDIAYSGTGAALRVYNSQATNPFGLLVDNTGATTADSNYVADFRVGGTPILTVLNSGRVSLGGAISTVNSFANITAGSYLDIAISDSTTYLFFAHQGAEHYGVMGIVYLPEGAAACEVSIIKQTNANLTASASGTNLRITNGIGATRTVTYGMLRIV